MKFYNRAIASIIAQPAKSLVLFLVSFILGTGIIMSFLIKSAINESTQYMLSRSNTAVTISMPKEMYEKVVKEIGNSSYVKYFDYNINSNVKSEIKNYTGKVSNYLKGGENITDYFDGSYKLLGVNDPQLLLIKQNKATLTKGRVFSEKEINSSNNSVIISEKLASINGLGINSMFKIVATAAKGDGGFVSRAYDMRVVGIVDLKDKNKVKSGSTKDEKELLKEEEIDKATYQNLIIAPNSTAKTINTFIKENSSGGNNQIQTQMSTPICIVDKPENLGKFIGDKKVILPERTNFVSDYDTITQSLSSTTILNNVATVTFISVTILTIAILTLVIVLFLINRRQEFGIYKALGEKTYKTVGQVVIETMIVGLLGFTLAIASSSTMAKVVSKEIMKNTQVQKSESSNISVSSMIPYVENSDLNNDFVMENYTIRITPQNMVIILLIGSATMLIASVGPAIYILRLDAKRIML